MNLTLTAYVAPKPSNGAQKHGGHFPPKSVLLSKKVCRKVSSCENFLQQSCNAFTGLSNRAMVGGNVFFYLKFWAKLTHSLQKRRLKIVMRLQRLSRNT